MKSITKYFKMRKEWRKETEKMKDQQESDYLRNKVTKFRKELDIEENYFRN